MKLEDFKPKKSRKQVLSELQMEMNFRKRVYSVADSTDPNNIRFVKHGDQHRFDVMNYLCRLIDSMTDSEFFEWAWKMERMEIVNNMTDTKTLFDGIS